MARGSELGTAVSGPSRVAGPDEAVSLEELQLAARNHGLPLETLRYDVTPTGLHYLLTVATQDAVQAVAAELADAAK